MNKEIGGPKTADGGNRDAERSRKPPTDIDRYKGPFAEAEIGNFGYTDQTRNRNSASAPEVDGTGGPRKDRLVGELDNCTEIREIGTQQEAGDKEKRDGDMRPRELEGDRWVHELSAMRSIKGGTRATAELDGMTAPKIPDKS
ncbi:MAG: hypothetical protein Q9225_001485 [Loekoesia sp. 1 TL-2023]